MLTAPFVNRADVSRADVSRAEVNRTGLFRANVLKRNAMSCCRYVLSKLFSLLFLIPSRGGARQV